MGWRRLWNYAQELVEARATEPRDDFTSDLLLATRQDLRALSVTKLPPVVFGLLLAGHETRQSARNGLADAYPSRAWE